MIRRGTFMDSRGQRVAPVIMGRAIINIIPLNYVSSIELVRVIKPFLSQAGAVYEYPTLNTIVLVDTPENINRGHGNS